MLSLISRKLNLLLLCYTLFFISNITKAATLKSIKSKNHSICKKELYKKTPPQPTTWYLDADGDGYYVDLVVSVNPPGSHWKISGIIAFGDCNDADPNVHEMQLWYLDVDNDNFIAAQQWSCSSPGAGWKLSGYAGYDCDDNDATATIEQEWVLDADGDSYFTDRVKSCKKPGNDWILVMPFSTYGDTDDKDPTVHRRTLFFKDYDEDGYYNNWTVSGKCPSFWGNQCLSPTVNCTKPYFNYYECNDNNGAITSGSGDGLNIWILDADNDGYTNTVVKSCASPGANYKLVNMGLAWGFGFGDCDDADPAKNYGPFGGCNTYTCPGLSLKTFYVLDADNDGIINSAVWACQSPGAGWRGGSQGWVNYWGDANDNDSTSYYKTLWAKDEDGDGYFSGTPIYAYKSPGAKYKEGMRFEDADDNDGTITDVTLWYLDADNDNHFISTQPSIHSPGAGWRNSFINGRYEGDCDDNDAGIFERIWYLDADGDGYYTAVKKQCSSPGSNWKSNAHTIGDCNDNDAAVYRSVMLFKDIDGDSYHSAVITMCIGATIPTGYSQFSNGKDQNDNNINITTQNPNYEITNLVACKQIIYNGKTYTANTTITDTVKYSSSIYDSIYRVTNITIQNTMAITNAFTIGGCNSVIYKGKTYTGNAIVNDTIKTSMGCDSVFNIANIVVSQITPVSNNIILKACSMVVYNNKTYTASGTVKDTLKSRYGCDSVYTTANITINGPMPVSDVETLFGCNDYTYKGITYYDNTVLGDTIRTLQGCDSIYKIVLINLRKQSTTTSNQNISVYASVVFNNKTYTKSSIVTDTFKYATTGCDSAYKVTNIYVAQNPFNTTCWKMVSSGHFHTIAIKNNGTLWAWGGIWDGALGASGDSTFKNIPIQIGNDTDWKSVDAGVNLTFFAIKNNGTLWAWGSNITGQFGNNTTTNSDTPIQIGTLNIWKSVSVGYSHVVAVQTNGTLWTWGDNFYGQLGNNTTTSSKIPIQVGTSTNWNEVDAGDDYTLALQTNGTLWAWGYNFYGQLGIGNTSPQKVPKQVGTSTVWQRISVGESYSQAIQTNGSLWSWGKNDKGQLGNNTITKSTIPLQIGTSTNWKNISAGAITTMAIKTDSTLWGWGNNDSGQLGNGTKTNSLVPLQIGTSKVWASASLGYSFSTVLKIDNSLWVSGSNILGYFGNATNVSSTTSVNVSCNDPITAFNTPVLTSFTPTTAKAGATVTIKGKYLEGTVRVSFGGTIATNFSIVNDSTITAIVAAGNSGDVTITTVGGIATKSGFNFCGSGSTKNINVAGCNSVVYNGKTYTANTIVKDTLLNIFGCDSVYNTANITVNKIIATTNTQNLFGCNSVVYKTKTYTASTVVKDTVKTSQGCDSIYNTANITIRGLVPTTNTQNLFGCNSVVYKTKTYTASTVVKDTVKTGQGCDSIYNTANITIRGLTPASTTLNPSTCNNYTYKNIVYYSSTIIKDTLKTNNGGCDSVYLTINVTVNPSVTGRIYHLTKGNISNVKVIQTGTAANTYNAIGNYNASCLSANSNIILKPTKNNDIAKANGVTSVDVLLVQRHILNVAKLNNVYKIIAADVDGNKAVNSVDVLRIKRLILGTDTTFTKGSGTNKVDRLWEFIDSAYIFPDTTNPFPFKDSISFTNLTSNKTNQTFIGVKLGDVNYDWNPAVAKLSTDKSIQLTANIEAGVVNGELRIPVTVTNFKELVAMQYTLHFDNKNYEFVGIENNKIGIDFNEKQATGNGNISMLWTDKNAEPKTLEDGTELFTLVLRSTVDGRLSTDLRLTIDNSITDIEAWDKDFNQHNIILTKQQKLQTSNIEQWSVSPNPTSGEIKISIVSKTNKIVSFELTDAQGKAIIKQTVELQKGNNSITLNLKQNSNITTGIYFLKAVGLDDDNVRKILVK